MEYQRGQSIPVLYATGTHYQVGYQVGRTFKSRIEEYFTEFRDLRLVFQKFYGTSEGKKVVDNYKLTATKMCPQYMEEMKGISDGSEVSYEEVFLMQIRVELQSYLQTKMVPECTTVLVNNENEWLMAHNEDTSHAAFNKGYILSATIWDPRGSIEREKFTAFCYPGILPGNCFSYTASGLALSVNALYAKVYYVENKIPRQFINRAMLAARDPDHLMTILANHGCGIATGCSVNMAFLPKQGERTPGCMSNIELCPINDEPKTSLSRVNIILDTDEDSVTHYKGHFVHYNMYEHMAVPEMDGRTTSSVHRKTRTAALPPPHNLQSALNILGDDKDREFPIFRTPQESDSGSTIATGVFDLLKRKLIVYYGNPKSTQPILEMSMLFEDREAQLDNSKSSEPAVETPLTVEDSQTLLANTEQRKS